MLVPVVGVARGGSGIAIVLIVDSEVERYCAVAAIAVGACKEMCQRLATCSKVRMLIPIIGVARGGSSITSVLVVDSEVERYCTIATIAVGTCKEMCQRLAACSKVRMLIPIIGVARGGSSITSVLVVDSEVERYCTIATIAVGTCKEMCQRLAACSKVRMLIPIIGVARNGGGVAGVLIVDSEVERYSAVATPAVGSCKEMCQCLVACSKVRMLVPVVGVARDGSSVTSILIVDSEVQRYSTVATIAVGTCKEMCQRLAACSKVRMLIPIIGVARGGSSITGVLVVDSEMQSIDAWTVVVVIVGIEFGSLAFGVSLPVARPCITIAGHVGEATTAVLVDGQMQCVDTGTAIVIIVVIEYLVVAFGIGRAMPFITVARHHRLAMPHIVGDIEVEGIDTGTAVLVAVFGTKDCGTAGVRQPVAMPLLAIGSPCVGVASGIGILGAAGITHGNDDSPIQEASVLVAHTNRICSGCGRHCGDRINRKRGRHAGALVSTAPSVGIITRATRNIESLDLCRVAYTYLRIIAHREIESGCGLRDDNLLDGLAVHVVGYSDIICTSRKVGESTRSLLRTAID